MTSLLFDRQAVPLIKYIRYLTAIVGRLRLDILIGDIHSMIDILKYLCRYIYISQVFVIIASRCNPHLAGYAEGTWEPNVKILYLFRKIERSGTRIRESRKKQIYFY